MMMMIMMMMMMMMMMIIIIIIIIIISSLLARQPLMGPDLLQKLCPFIPVEGDLLPILDL